MTDELRMEAYYYSFTQTGSRVVDKVLSAVACAGKAFHSTSEWNDDAICPGHTGDTPVDWIQNAADEAAHEIKRLRAALRLISDDAWTGPLDYETDRRLRLERIADRVRAALRETGDD